MKRIFNANSLTFDEIGVESETSSKKRPNVSYKKLVVPVRMRSIYWKFFGFPADEARRITTKEVIVCTLCKAQMVYNRNTSNLRTHLRCRHKDLITRIEQGESQRLGSESPSITKNMRGEVNNSFQLSEINIISPETPSMVSRRPVKDVPTLVVSEEGNENDLANISIIFPNDEELLSYTQEKHSTEESVGIHDAVISFIVSDLIAPGIVDGSGFHCLMSRLSDKSILIPNENKIISEIIPSIYITAKQQIHNALKSGCITDLSLSMEEWTSLDNITCLSVYVHYFLPGSTELTTKLLRTITCTGIDTTDEWERVIEKLLNEWNINLDVVSAVLAAFSFPKLKLYLDSRNVIQIPCFTWLMEKLCSELVFRLPDVVELLKKCRLTMELIQTSIIEKDNDYELNDNYDEYSSHIFGFDKKGSWLTTYYMLYGLLLRKNKISELSLESNGSALNTTDWKRISDLVGVLESLKTIVTTFFEEKCPMISLVNPLLWKVTNNVFEYLDEDSSFIIEIKKIFKQNLNDAYANNEVRSFTEMATMLDPRFKSFVNQNANYNPKRGLEEALILLVNAKGLESCQQLQSQESPNSVSKKPNRLSGMNMLFNNLKVKKQALTVEDKIRNEITYFEAESNALLEECPLLWWQNMANKCPNLIRLARKYLCVPAMVLINNNENILDRLKFYDKRATLSIEIADMLLFLHLNNEL